MAMNALILKVRYFLEFCLNSLILNRTDFWGEQKLIDHVNAEKFFAKL